MECFGSLLASRLAAGDDSALAEAVGELRGAVYASALRVLGDTTAAEDVAQDVFVDLWRHPEHYHPELGTLRTYLTLRAHCRACDVGRAEHRRVLREERHVQLAPRQRDASPAEQVTTAAAASAVRRAVAQLPGDQRLVVELAYFRGLSFRAVACALGVPEGTVKSRVRLALAKLGRTLDRELLEPS